MDVGGLKEYNDPNNEADGGGTVPLPPGFGGRDDSSTTPNLIYVPGTNTVWDYDENPSDPSAPWTPKEGIDELVNPGTPSGAHELEIPQLPKDVNRVVEIPDVNNDGDNDLAIVTKNGVYLMLTESGTNNYYPPKLLSDEIGNVRDVTALDYNVDGVIDIVVVTDDQTRNRIYMGDPTDPTLSNLGVDDKGGLRHEYIENSAGPGNEKDSVRVVTIDVDNDGIDDGFVVANTNFYDDLYLKYTDSVKMLVHVRMGTDTPTYDVDAVRLDPTGTNTDLTIVFAKDGADEYFVLPSGTWEHPGDPAGPAGFPSNTGFPTFGPNAKTHTLKFQTVPGGVYGDTALGDLERAHLYTGHKQTNVDEPLGAYYHNPGTAGITFATMSATKNDVRAVAAAPFGDSIATVAPDLLGTTMEVTVLKENQPPSVIFGTAGGTQVVITQHNTGGDGTLGEFYVNAIGEPTYDGLMDLAMSGAPIPSVFHSATLLKTDGTATTLDPAVGRDQLRDLESSNGLLRSADLDGDGYPDVITGVYTVLSKNGRYDDDTEERHTPQRYWNGPMPRDVVAFDYDDDTDMDLIVLTQEGSLYIVPNDGSGIFSTLTQQRFQANSFIGSLETLAVTRASTPRMIAVRNGGVAIAQDGAVRYYTYNAGTGFFSPVTTLTKTGETVLDMKTINLNGKHDEPEALVVLWSGNEVEIATVGIGGTRTFNKIGSVQRLAVGNFLGDAPYTTVEHLGQTNNAGALQNPNLDDPRSPDIALIQSDGEVYLIEGYRDTNQATVRDNMALYNGGTATALDLKGGTNAKFDFGGSARTITAVDAHDINGDGLDDLALGFEDATNTVYRSIIYFTTGKASPTPADLKLYEKKLSPVADTNLAGGSTSTSADTASTRRVLLVDQDLDGNVDIVYASDENAPARVTYARPPGDPNNPTSGPPATAPIAAEVALDSMTDGAAMRDSIELGVLKWLDQSLIDAFKTGGPHDENQMPASYLAQQVCSSPGQTECRPAAQRGMINHKGELITTDPTTGVPTHENEITHPQQYPLSLTAGTEPVQTLHPTNPLWVPEHYMQKTDTPVVATSSATSADPQQPRGQCRAHNEPALPVHVSFQLDFPTIPCPKDKWADCVLPEPIAASKKLIPMGADATLPLCATSVTKVWKLATVY